MKFNRGSSLVELILYTGLLTTILVVLYQVFSLAGYQKLGEIVEDELYVNANSVIADLTRSITQSTEINEPLPGASSTTLQLNGGQLVYQLDGNNRLVKTESGISEFLTTDRIVFNNIMFSRRGPSTASPTIIIDFTLAGAKLVEGRERNERFTTSVSVR